MDRTRSTPRIAIALALLLASAGCGAGSEEALAAQRELRAAHERQADRAIEVLIESLPRMAEKRAARRALGLTLRDAAERQAEVLIPDAAIREVVLAFYEARAFLPVFVAEEGLTIDGQAVVDAVLQSDGHGLWPADLGVPELKSSVDALTHPDGVASTLANLQLGEHERGALRDHLVTTATAGLPLPSTAMLQETLLSNTEANPVPDFPARWSTYADAIERARRMELELELRIAASFVRYARALRVDNLNWVPDAELARRGMKREDPGQAAALRRELSLQLLDQGASGGGFAPVLSALPPGFPQYTRLVESLARYRAVHAAGGWPELPEGRELGRGVRDPSVEILRQRLAAEEYLASAEGPEELDEGLANALAAYQRTHQLRETGTLTEETRTSLDVPVDRRIAQILVTLQRWRESRAARDFGREYVHVAVPDFHAELWDAGEVVHRWKVVVGQRKVGRDERGRETINGITPLFSDTMLYIVFNPYWNVPDTIRKAEYDPLIRKDPDWLDKNGFEIWREPRSGTEILRQVPGEKNALGLVKFLFPNEHDVYMHDTPQKHLFKLPVRPFSHGCIRVEKPLLLAEILVSRDRGISRGAAKRLIEKELEAAEEKWFTLRRPLPIHIEYFVVRVDDAGRTHFLADVYRHDRPLVEETEARWFQHVTPDDGEAKPMEYEDRGP